MPCSVTALVQALGAVILGPTTSLQLLGLFQWPRHTVFSRPWLLIAIYFLQPQPSAREAASRPLLLALLLPFISASAVIAVLLLLPLLLLLGKGLSWLPELVPLSLLQPWLLLPPFLVMAAMPTSAVPATSFPLCYQLSCSTNDEN